MASKIIISQATEVEFAVNVEERPFIQFMTERSLIECQTRHQESPGSNLPFPTVLKSLGIFVLSTTPQFTQMYRFMSMVLPGGWKCQ